MAAELTMHEVEFRHGVQFLAERPGSGDGERKTLLTRQIAFEPLPASVLFALVLAVNVSCRSIMILNSWRVASDPAKANRE
jgi:hypothetical protein